MRDDELGVAIQQSNNQANLCNLWLKLNLRVLRALRGLAIKLRGNFQ